MANCVRPISQGRGNGSPKTSELATLNYRCGVCSLKDGVTRNVLLALTVSRPEAAAVEPVGCDRPKCALFEAPQLSGHKCVPNLQQPKHLSTAECKSHN